MKPIDYIYENIDCFNLTIFKQILEESGETVSEEIYDYLMETTWNTNPALLKQYGLDIERSNGEGPKYVIKLAKYGEGMEVYADDSPWKPTAEELKTKLSLMIDSAMKEKGYNSMDEISTEQQLEVGFAVKSMVDKEIAVYSLKGNKLNYIMEGWADVSIEEMMQQTARPTETFIIGDDSIAYTGEVPK